MESSELNIKYKQMKLFLGQVLKKKFFLDQSIILVITYTWKYT